MRDVAYARAVDVDDVVSALADRGTAVIAGGTELLNWMRLGVADPTRLIDVGDLDELRAVVLDGDPDHGGTLRIGALTTLGDLATDPLVERFATALRSAAHQAASVQIRNRATTGGNVLQRTRCPYFRAEVPSVFACNKRRPGSGCAALAGHQPHHAVFGGTDACIAVHPSDPAVALAALDAAVELVGPNGARVVQMRDFLLTQHEAAELGDPLRESRLEPGEMITGYSLPVRPTSRSAYVKVRERASYEYALVSAAASVVVAGSSIESVTLALGSVAQRPWRLDAAEAALAGVTFDEGVIRSAVASAMSGADPVAGSTFKVPMAIGAAVRAVLEAGGSR